MRTKDILKEAIRNFEGTVIVVSHDRDFLNGLADKVYEFANRNVKEYLGGVADFLAAKKSPVSREYEQLHKPKNGALPAGIERVEEPAENKMSFEERKQLNREIKKAEQRVEKAEQEIARLEAVIRQMEEKMASGEVGDDLLKAYGQAKSDLEKSMEEWEQATEAFEEIKRKK